MTACRGCEAEGAGNFCADCGLPLKEWEAGQAPEPSLLGAEKTDATRATDRVRAGSRRRSVALGMALMFFLGAGMYAAFRSPEPEPVPELAVDEVGDEEGAAAEEDAVEAETAEEADPEGEEPDPIEGPWIAGDSHWYIVVAAQGGMHRIDTRTGVSTNLEIDGYPLGRMGDRIVLVPQGRVVITDDATLSAEPPIQLPAPLEDANIAVGGPFWLTEGLSDDVFWVQRYDSALEFDLRSGSLRREIRLPDSYSGPFPSFSPDFRTPLSGGVYRLDPDPTSTRYARILDGRILAQSDGAILVNSCGPELECASRWVDALTLEPRDDLVAPDHSADVWFIGGRLAGGRFVGADFGSVFDVQTGDTIRLSEPRMNSMFNGDLEISPDGLVTAHVSGSWLQVQSTVIGTPSTADLEGLRSGTRPLFVPLPES
ncbi:MAG: hypothetical protein HKN24_00150 [Acidimicrobiales bacterium]|nr:hypothetical protein [Acidimicrobiales bacterium]